jgi:hypothetical protein
MALDAILFTSSFTRLCQPKFITDFVFHPSKLHVQLTVSLFNHRRTQSKIMERQSSGLAFGRYSILSLAAPGGRAD